MTVHSVPPEVKEITAELWVALELLREQGHTRTGSDRLSHCPTDGQMPCCLYAADP